MQAIRRVSEPMIERRGALDNRVCVRFGLNRQPEEAWVRVFRAHAASSVLSATNALFGASEASIEVAKQSGVEKHAPAMHYFIDCSKLGPRSLPGPAPGR